MPQERKCCRPSLAHAGAIQSEGEITMTRVVDACCTAWNALTAETGRIRSLTAYPYLEQVSKRGGMIPSMFERSQLTDM